MAMPMASNRVWQAPGRLLGIANRLAALLVMLALAGGIAAGPAWAHDDDDSLYISEVGDDTVKRYEAKTGAYLGSFVSPGSCRSARAARSHLRRAQAVRLQSEHL
jgi:hypothetical protein